MRTLQNLREELPHCLPEYRAQFMQALGVAIVGETSVEMAYYPEVAAVLGSARLLPKTSATRTWAWLTLPALSCQDAPDGNHTAFPIMPRAAGRTGCRPGCHR